MDLIDHYIREEPNHIPLLLERIKNKDSLTEGEFFSNSFNFNVDFFNKMVKIVDEVGIYYKDYYRSLSINIGDLVKRITF